MILDSPASVSETCQLTQSPSAKSWLSAHLFSASGSNQDPDLRDRILLELVSPWLETCQRRVSRAFFIRYNRYGPHIRLRVEGDQQIIESWGKGAIAEMAQLSKQPEADGIGKFYPSRHPLLKHVRFLRYQPEVERYGGESGLKVAESFFALSSEVSLGLLAGLQPGDEDHRKALALLAMVVLLQAMFEHPGLEVRCAEVYRDFAWTVHQRLSEVGAVGRLSSTEKQALFADGYRQQPTELLTQAIHLRRILADGGESAPGPLRSYFLGLLPLRAQLANLWRAGDLVFGTRKQHADWTDSRLQLLPSYLHMTSNRLGISLIEEAYLAELAARIVAMEGTH